MTNLEWVRTLSAKELAKLLGDDCYMCSKSKGGCDMNCESGYITWLNAEHKEEIKPCPFCGGKPFINKDCVHYFVSCSCGAHGTFGTTREQAIEAWNRRVDNENA